MDDVKKNADELLAKNIKAIQDKVDSMEETLGKSNEDVLKLSEFKSFEERVTSDIKKMDDRLKEKPAMTADEKKLSEIKNFENELRFAAMVKHGGKDKFSSFERVKSLLGEEKAMQVNNDPRAGYITLPPEFKQEIIDQAAREYSPMRSISRIITTSANRVQIPAATAHGVASWVAEAGTTSEDTTLTFGLEDIPVHKATALIKYTVELMNDSAFNLPGVLMTDYSGAWGVLEGTAHISGTGIGQPEGILTHGDVSYTASGNATALTADGIINTFYAQKEIYANSSSWVMRRATMGTVAGFKGGDGQYLLGNLNNMAGFRLIGLPVLESPDMPAVGANAFPIALVARNAYTIVDQTGTMIQIIDPYTSKTTGVVEFMLAWFSGGQLTNAEAVRKVKVAVA